MKANKTTRLTDVKKDYDKLLLAPLGKLEI